MAVQHALAADGLALDVCAEGRGLQDRTGTDPVIDRGAYLVEGLGHCGACHTPRALTMQEKSLSAADGSNFLAGSAPLEGWIAKSLRGDHKDGLGSWSEEQLVQFLKTGRSDRSAVFGGMSDVVTHSMQYMTDADLTAIARYLKSLPATDPNDHRISTTRKPPKPCGTVTTASAARRCTSTTARRATAPMATVTPACSRRWRAIRCCNRKTRLR